MNMQVMLLTLSHSSEFTLLFRNHVMVNSISGFFCQAMTEGETLQWLNESLNVMWPICMEKFASQHFFTPIAPWFLKKFKPKFVVRSRDFFIIRWMTARLQIRW